MKWSSFQLIGYCSNGWSARSFVGCCEAAIESWSYSEYMLALFCSPLSLSLSVFSSLFGIVTVHDAFAGEQVAARAR